MPQADLQCFSVSKKGIKSKKAHDRLRAKPSQHTALCVSWMRRWEKGELCCFGKDMVQCPLSWLLGGEKSPFSEEWFLGEYIHWGCSVPVPPSPVSNIRPWVHVKLTWTPSCAKKDFASASVAS